MRPGDKTYCKIIKNIKQVLIIKNKRLSDKNTVNMSQSNVKGFFLRITNSIFFFNLVYRKPVITYI